MTRPHWTVAETKHGAEHEAARNVAAQGFQHYLPRYRERNRDGVRAVRCLFPGYLFVEWRSQWRAICSTRGIRRVLTSAPDTPAMVSREDVESLRRGEDHLGYVVLDSEENPPFSLLQSVAAVRGMFAEKYGIYVGMGRRGTARVQFQLLGASAEYDVNVCDLVAATL